MSNQEPVAGLTISRDDFDLLYDALRFARDEFFDENRLSWSNAEYSRLQEIIDDLEPLVEANRVEV